MVRRVEPIALKGWIIRTRTQFQCEDEKQYEHDRPKECVKDKPKREADFIVRYDPDNGIGKKGKGAKATGIGSAQAYLVHPELGEIEIAFVGNGITKERVVEYANPALYPRVWQVEFEDWTKAGSLTHPRFVRVRDDKQPEECSVEQNPNWEEHYQEG